MPQIRRLHGGIIIGTKSYKVKADVLRAMFVFIDIKMYFYVRIIYSFVKTEDGEFNEIEPIASSNMLQIGLSVLLRVNPLIDASISHQSA